MPVAGDRSPEGEDRTAWDRAWRAMPHRRLDPPLPVSPDSRLGVGVAATISEDPPEFFDRAVRTSEICPICGVSTIGAERLPATIHPQWPSGLTVGVGVWVHATCFEGCPPADGPASIPW